MSNKKKNKEQSDKEEQDVHVNGNGKDAGTEEAGYDKDAAEKGNLNEAEDATDVEQDQEQASEEEHEQEEELTEEEKLQKQLNEMKEKYLRLYSEFENFKKRTGKEKEELRKNATDDLITDLLPVLDDFDRAIASMEDAEDVDAVKEGVHLVYDKFFKILQSKGLQPMEVEGADFNTDEHEAVSQLPAENEEQKGKVMHEVQKGYYLNDKVIRFAKVVTGS